MSLPPSHGHSVKISTVSFSRKGAWEFETSLNLVFEFLGASLLVAMHLCHRVSSIYPSL